MNTHSISVTYCDYEQREQRKLENLARIRERNRKYRQSRIVNQEFEDAIELMEASI